MKLQWLKDIVGDAYTEELDAKVCTALGERFVARADFNDKNTKLKEAKAQIARLTEGVKARDGRPENWGQSLGDMPNAAGARSTAPHRRRGTAVRYPTHREIVLELFERWA